jgi:hypothetical protein
MTALIILLVPFGGALAARLVYRGNDLAWVAAVITGLIAFWAIQIGSLLKPVETAAAISVAAGLGVIAPDLWRLVRYFFRLQTLTGLMATVCVIIWFSFSPFCWWFATTHLAIISMMVGIWVMFEPLFTTNN